MFVKKFFPHSGLKSALLALFFSAFVGNAAYLHGGESSTLAALRQAIGASKLPPKVDGRGVVVAVFGTGVDPGAAGMLRTNEGRTRIVDLIDATGCGDVPTRLAKVDGAFIEGVTGTKLQLDKAWLAPKRKFYVGVKRAFDFCPTRVIDRLKRERRKAFDLAQHHTESRLREEIESASHEQGIDNVELQTRLTQLRWASQHYDDPGPVYNCVVFHDGQVWRAAVDTDEDGDLSDEKLVTNSTCLHGEIRQSNTNSSCLGESLRAGTSNFRRERQYATFGGGAELNFAVNIYGSPESDRPPVLSIVVGNSSHGTHVARIVSGVAPETQIVSVKVAHPRLDRRETALAVMRALNAAVENGCDVIHMRFSKPTSVSARGHLVKSIEHAANEHKIVLVAASGNRESALSTDKASLTCGAAALLISAMKAKGKSYSPHSIRHALENTAKPTKDNSPLEHGKRIIQVGKALAYLTKHADNPAREPLFRFPATVTPKATKPQYDLSKTKLKSSTQGFTLSDDQPFVRVEVSAPVRAEKLSPRAQLTTRRRTLHPQTSNLHLLDPIRDRLPDGRRLYELTLTYACELQGAAKVTPAFPTLANLSIYNSPYGGYQWSLFNAGKRLVAEGDVQPKTVALGKGRHTLQLQVHHVDPRRLERLEQMPMTLDVPLAKAIAVQAFATRTAAVSADKPFTGCTLPAGAHMPLFFRQPRLSSLELAVNETLIGSVQYGASSRSYKIRVQPSVAPIENPDEQKPAIAITPEDEIRDLKVRQLTDRIATAEKQTFLYDADRLLKEYPNHLPILVAKLHYLDVVTRRKKHLTEVVAATDAVLAISRKPSKIHSPFPELRQITVDTLYRKGRALGYMELPDVIAKYPIADPVAHDKAFEANFAELARLVDTTDQKYFLLHIRRDRRKGRYGAALALLNKYIPTSEPNYWYFKKRRDIYEQLGWKHLHDQESKWLWFRFPK